MRKSWDSGSGTAGVPGAPRGTGRRCGMPWHLVPAAARRGSASRRSPAHASESVNCGSLAVVERFGVRLRRAFPGQVGCPQERGDRVHTGGFAKWTSRFEDERERRRAKGDPDWGKARRCIRRSGPASSASRSARTVTGPISSARRTRRATPTTCRRFGSSSPRNRTTLVCLLVCLLREACRRCPGTGATRSSCGCGVSWACAWNAGTDDRGSRGATLLPGLRDGTEDALTRMCRADLVRRAAPRPVPLRAAARLPCGVARAMRRPVMVLWRLLLLVVSLVVAADHGPALRRLGIGRLRFVGDVMTCPMRWSPQCWYPPGRMDATG